MPNPLNWIAEKFSKDTSKMLIVTGALGFVLSSTAQCFSIVNNRKISAKEKAFLLPQEFIDALINIATFLAVTTTTRHFSAKLYKTGKFATKGIRNYINKCPELKNEVGKFDFNLDKYLAETNASESLIKEYNSYKNCGTTIATVGATILSSNIITPILRNRMAAFAQKKQIESVNNIEEGDVKKDPTKAIKILNKVIYSTPGTRNMRI